MKKVTVRSTVATCMAVVAIIAELVGWLRGDPSFTIFGLIALWIAFGAKSGEARLLRRALESTSKP